MKITHTCNKNSTITYTSIDTSNSKLKCNDDDVYVTVSDTSDRIIGTIVDQLLSLEDEKVVIKNVKFNPPATVVIWTDGTKTVVKDEDMTNCKNIVVDESSNTLRYSIPVDNHLSKEVYTNWTRWKENGFINAMLKKIDPDYIRRLEKWCH